MQLKKDILEITSDQFNCTNAIYSTTSDSEAFSGCLCACMTYQQSLSISTSINVTLTRLRGPLI